MDKIFSIVCGLCQTAKMTNDPKDAWELVDFMYDHFIDDKAVKEMIAKENEQGLPADLAMELCPPVFVRENRNFHYTTPRKICQQEN